MFLHQNIITGPIKSRRLGSSLGINILPNDHKICNYNCVYCECGWAPDQELADQMPSREDVTLALEEALKKAVAENTPIDSITFSGNGESSLHPDFLGIMQDTARLRDTYLPKTQITVISNASRIHRSEVIEGLKLADTKMLKLDAGNAELYNRINLNKDGLLFEDLVNSLRTFPSPFILQTLFFRGSENGEKIDNTKGEDFIQWLDLVKSFPTVESVMVYGLDRETPAKQLEKISAADLQAIADRIIEAGIPAKAYY